MRLWEKGAQGAGHGRVRAGDMGSLSNSEAGRADRKDEPAHRPPCGPSAFNQFTFLVKCGGGRACKRAVRAVRSGPEPVFLAWPMPPPVVPRTSPRPLARQHEHPTRTRGQGPGKGYWVLAGNSVQRRASESPAARRGSKGQFNPMLQTWSGKFQSSTVDFSQQPRVTSERTDA